MKRRLVFLSVIVVGICIVVLSCFKSTICPDITSVQNQFLDNYENVSKITTFMVESGYDNIYISDADGSMFADLQERQMDDVISAAVNELMKNGKYIRIAKRGNTIWFMQWKGIRDTGCGIAYTINGVDLPEVDYAIEMVALPAENWFYYVYDYNVWRVAHNTGDGSVCSEGNS